MTDLTTFIPNLSEKQQQQLTALRSLYETWNARINVISRKDIDNFELHHVMHSLSIARFHSFSSGTSILDLGTGGGFPGIPLAIVFPDCNFTLIDGIGKKIRVVKEVVSALGLKNVDARQCRCEEEHRQFNYIVSRGVMPLADMIHLTKKNISTNHVGTLHNGLICLKGGNLDDEIASVKNTIQIHPISQWISDEWFSEKYILYVEHK